MSIYPGVLLPLLCRRQFANKTKLESGGVDIGRKSIVKCSRSIAGLNIVFPFQSLWHAVNCRKVFAVGHSLKKGTDAIWQHFVCHWEPWCCDNVLFKRSHIANDSCIAFGTQSIPTVRSWRSQQGRKCNQQLPIHDEVDGVVLHEWHSQDYDHTESCICFHVLCMYLICDLWGPLKLCRSIISTQLYFPFFCARENIDGAVSNFGDIICISFQHRIRTGIDFQVCKLCCIFSQ